MGWVRSQFLEHHYTARLDAPPHEKLESYARYVLDEVARTRLDDVDDETETARNACESAAIAMLEFSSRSRPRRARYATPRKSATAPLSTSTRGRQAEIRARYGRPT